MGIEKYIGALLKHWWTLLSSAIFTAIGLYSLWQGKTNHWTIMASITTALILFFVASFQAWNEEHKKLEAELAKHERPDLMASFLCLGNPPQFSLRLQTASSTPAVGIQIDNVVNEEKTLHFYPPSGPIVGLAGGIIESRMFEDGRPSVYSHGDVAELFEAPRDKMLAYLRNSNMKSDVLTLRVRFSNLDSAANRRGWILSVPFWWDYDQQAIGTGTPSVESLQDTL